MQFKKYAVVGVLVTLYLSTDSWCRSIPENKSDANLNLADRENATSSNKFQICGTALTDVILHYCTEVLNTLNEESYSGAGPKITEKCCSKPCTEAELGSYCGRSRLSLPKKTPQENFLEKEKSLLNNLIRSQPSSLLVEKRPPHKAKNEGNSEVRVRKRKYCKRKWGKNKKRKNNAYESFGHYLLKLKRGKGVRDNMAKKLKRMNQTWRSIEIGTISPEMEDFGGQPIVEIKRNRSNFI